MRRRIWLAILSCVIAGCNPGNDREPVLGEAYVGSVSLQLRQELTARAALVATVKHGDHLELIGKRRRFLKVRTESGAEGWVDGRQLLSTKDMSDLRALAERAGKAPSQGRASVFEALNVHTIPNRQSPSFFQIAVNAQVDVITHQRTERVPYEPAEFIPALPVKPLAAARRKKAEPSVPPPPPGKPPEVPEDWMELSGRPDGTIPEKDDPPQSPKQDISKPPVPMDVWSLVRAKDGRAGWVLSRMLLMGIPDEVAQHAERARIAAYFTIGRTTDRGETKPAYLWATLAQVNVPFHFESLRIFIWNSRRHRYETSFIERNLKGYLPLLLRGAPDGSTTGFRVVTIEKDGSIVEREYAISGLRARVVSRHPATLPEEWYVPAKIQPGKAPAPADPQWQDKAKGLIEGIKGKLKR
jgi:hypothetical protein